MRFLVLAAAFAVAPFDLAFAQQGANPMDRLMAADANRDGQITKAEARTAREAAFPRLDANSDGFLSSEERRGGGDRRGRGGGGGDADNDGRISKAEYMAAPYRMFERLDANRNDVLEASELEAARAFMGSRKKGTP